MTLDAARIDKYLRRCEEAIHAASTLLEENLYTESISRSYYSVIHAVMLLLAESGSETRNTEEAERLFTAELVRGMKLEGETLTLFDDVRRIKKATPHDYLSRYSGEDAASVLPKARAFLDIVRRHFKADEAPSKPESPARGN